MNFLSPKVTIGRLKTEKFLDLKTPLVELVSLARNASACSSEPIILYASGGVDSQAMVEVFARANVAARVITLSLESSGTVFNSFDVDLARNIAQTYGFCHDIFVVDPVEFFHSGRYGAIMEKYQLTVPGLSLYAFLIENSPKDHMCLMAGQPPYPIMGTGEISIKGEDNYFHERAFGCNELEGHGYFLCANPRIVASWLQLPTFQSCVSFGAAIPVEHQFKRQLYLEAGFAPGDQKRSHHGLEEFIPFFQKKTGRSWSSLY